jgi:hypothetical protein
VSNPSANVPYLLNLIPEGNAKLVIRYCFDTLNLSVEETDKALMAASKLVASIDWLLRGGQFSSTESER